MDSRKLAAVLAGLRLVQEQRQRMSEGVSEILTDGGAFEALNDDEIDNLCEYLNGNELLRPSAKVTLVLTVEYETEDDSMQPSDLETAGAELLEALVRRATNEGLLTGSTDLVVKNYDSKVF